MCKTEIFAEILDVVSNETEIPTSVILSPCKNADVVDARHIMVYLLSRYGFYPSSIASFMHITKRAVNAILTKFHDREKNGKILRINLENARKLLGMY